MKNKASEWERKEIAVSDIYLDKLNTRIAWMEDNEISQSTMLKIFWEKYNIREIVESIGTSGFFKHEAPIVILDPTVQSRYIVIEGNRRVSALKVILHPELAPITQKKWLLELSDSISKDIAKIDVYIAPSRESCYPILVQKHASEDNSSWKPLMKAHLYWKYMKEHPKESLDSVAKTFDTTQGKIKEYLKLYNIFVLVKSVEGLPDDVSLITHDAINIPITNFQRILLCSSVRTDLKLDETFKVTDETAALFSKRMKNIIIDIIRKTEDSRTLNKDEDIEKLYFGYNPPEEKPITGTKQVKPASPQKMVEPEDYGKESDGESDPPPSPLKTRQPGVRRETKSIMRTRIPFNLKNASALRLIYDELYSLPVDTKPNASVALFRVFLDKATRKLMERNGLSKCPIVDKSGNIKEERKFTEANFSDCLRFLVSHNAPYIPDPVKVSLRYFLDPEQSKTRISGMNQLIHNHEITFSAEEAKSLWPQFESYVRVLLTE